MRWLAAVALALAAAAPPTARQLEELQRQQAASQDARRAAETRAAQAQDAERGLADQRVAAAARLRDAEQAVADARDRIAGLERARDAARSGLAARAAELGPMLPVALRLSLYPAETLLAAPVPPDEAVRGLLVLGALARTLERQAAALRAEQERVASLREAVDAQLPALDSAQTDMAAQTATLDAQLGAARDARRAAEDAAADAARRAAEDAARTDSLRAAIARIEADQRTEQARAQAEADSAARQQHIEAAEAARERKEALARPAGPGLTAPRGQLTAPVVGSVSRGFGQPTEAGPSAGVSYVTLGGARVVSPCGGRAVFAGPFRSYGRLLIVDCGGGFHFVLAGFDRLDAQPGQPVQAGEPVGVMPSGRPTLYMELRHDGQPTDPAPFLRGRG